MTKLYHNIQEDVDNVKNIAAEGLKIQKKNSKNKDWVIKGEKFLRKVLRKNPDLLPENISEKDIPKRTESIFFWEKKNEKIGGTVYRYPIIVIDYSKIQNKGYTSVNKHLIEIFKSFKKNNITIDEALNNENLTNLAESYWNKTEIYNGQSRPGREVWIEGDIDSNAIVGIYPGIHEEMYEIPKDFNYDKYLLENR